MTEAAGGGRQVALDVDVGKARLEDFLRLALDETPVPMTGRLDTRFRLLLPPGDADVPQRLALDGEFSVDDGRFSGHGVQRKIQELSKRGQGKPEAPATVTPVFSNLEGRFVLSGGTLRFSSLAFRVPGARVSLAGTYTAPGARRSTSAAPCTSTPRCRRRPRGSSPRC